MVRNVSYFLYSIILCANTKSQTYILRNHFLSKSNVPASSKPDCHLSSCQTKRQPINFCTAMTLPLFASHRLVPRSPRYFRLVPRSPRYFRSLRYFWLVVEISQIFCFLFWEAISYPSLSGVGRDVRPGDIFILCPVWHFITCSPGVQFSNWLNPKQFDLFLTTCLNNQFRRGEEKKLQKTTKKFNFSSYSHSIFSMLVFSSQQCNKADVMRPLCLLLSQYVPRGPHPPSNRMCSRLWSSSLMIIELLHQEISLFWIYVIDYDHDLS